MRRAIAAGLAALLLAPGLAGAQAPALALKPQDVDVVQAPTVESRFDYFPAQARQQRIEGRATVACTILETGALSACRVVSEEPAGQGFGAATVRLGEEQVKVAKTARDGSPTAGRTFQFARIWALRGGPATKSTMPLDQGRKRDDGLVQKWTQLPRIDHVMHCFRTAMPKAEAVTFVFACKSTTSGKLEACRVVKNSRAEDPRYEKAGLCAIEAARIQVTGADGQPVAGADVDVPFGFTR